MLGFALWVNRRFGFCASGKACLAKVWVFDYALTRRKWSRLALSCLTCSLCVHVLVYLRCFLVGPYVPRDFLPRDLHLSIIAISPACCRRRALLMCLRLYIFFFLCLLRGLLPSRLNRRRLQPTNHIIHDGRTHTRSQFVRVCMDNQPANVRLFVMHGGVETFVELVGSAFQHAHSLSASSSSNSSTAVAVVPPLAITSGDGDEVSPSGSSGSEEHFGSAAGGGRVPRRERASDMSVALTCRELVVECISCLSSALEVG